MEGLQALYTMDLVLDRGGIVSDRISNLSDDVIYRILSFVDMKDAIQTSKLSRRWRHIWTSMPHLNFDTRDFPQFDKFMKHALSHRNNSASVSSVILTFTETFAVQSIIKYAFSHNVEQLTMRWCTGNSLKFPPCLFSSHTLRILTLTPSSTNTKICFLPGSGWDFPSLETLSLKNILFSCADGTDKSLNPFSKCVNLKNLTLDRFYIYHVEMFIIYAPQLSNLTITNAFRFPKAINVVAPQLVNLTASLTPFYCHHYSMMQFLTTEGFNSLEKVELSKNLLLPECLQILKLSFSPYRDNFFPLLVDILHKCCSAKVLILDKHVSEVISLCLDKLTHEPCPFNKLKCVKIHGVSCYPTRAKNYLLQNSPNATFITDSPSQVQQKRSREPELNDGMANKVAKLEAENKQAETTDKEKTALEAKIPTQDEVIIDAAPTANIATSSEQGA